MRAGQSRQQSWGVLRSEDLTSTEYRLSNNADAADKASNSIVAASKSLRSESRVAVESLSRAAVIAPPGTSDGRCIASPLGLCENGSRIEPLSGFFELSYGIFLRLQIAGGCENFATAV